MSIIVEISNVENLKLLRDIYGNITDSEAVERSIERTIKDYQAKLDIPEAENAGGDLPDEYWDELFSEPMLPNNAGSKAVVDERNEARY